MNKDIVLFDMDGTLTEARQAFASFLSSPLWSLSEVADIGVVTGSDMNYVEEQLDTLLQNHSIRYCLHILPCNGTKWYIPPRFPAHSHSLVHEAMMEKEIGKDKYRKLIEILLAEQLWVSDFDIPLTGNFITARGSMLNWSPIGRSADNRQRSYFKKFDKKIKLRNQCFTRLRTKLDSENLKNVTIKLGGDTSFDIYPAGWDKTYALRHFDGRNVWFVGDRARTPKGNDYEIFQACGWRSYHTTGPSETKDVIGIVEEKIRSLNGPN